MAVRQVRQKDRKGQVREFWQADFRHNGKRYREVSPVQTKRGARAYELQRKRELEAALITAPTQQVVEVATEVPTFKVFVNEFMAGRAPNTSGLREMEAKRTILNKHLLPRFKHHRLDEIGVRNLEQMKAEIRAMPRAPKTVNNVLTILRTILKYAVEVGELEKIPNFVMMPVPAQDFDFLDFDEYEVLLEAVAADPALYLAVLLAAEAGLRAGEIAGIRWQDVNFQLNRLKVLNQIQQNQELPPKWNSIRAVPLTARLARALKAHRHLAGEWVLVRPAPDTGFWTKETLRWQGARAYRLASLPKPKKPWHCLRHTFCSHLAMRGAPPRAIQELAGHKSIQTTMRYMHLSPRALTEAISLLDGPVVTAGSGATSSEKVGKTWAIHG